MNRMNKEGTKSRERKVFPGIIVVAFITAVITFFLLLNVEKSMLSDYEKGLVWVAAGNLQKSLEISKANMGDCFTQTEMDKKMIPESAVTDISLLAGCRTVFMIPENSILTTMMFENSDEHVDRMVKPVIAGCKADDLFQVVSGILRSGDRIHIYTADPETGDVYLIWDHIFVQEVFDSSGSNIAAGNKTQAAYRVNILMEKDDVEQFYSELARGSLRVVKAINNGG